MLVKDFREELNNSITAALNADKKPETLEVWNQLYNGMHYELKGDDTEMRPITVGLQGRIESVLATMAKHKNLPITCTFHTPAPPTPLKTGADIQASVDEEIAQDPARAATVTERIKTVKKMLKAGINVTCVHPKDSPMSDEQRNIYNQNLAQYEQNLEDKPSAAECSPDSPESGATYLIRLEDGVVAFSLRAYQAKTPQNGLSWEVWLGDSRKQVVAQRVEEVQNSNLIQSIEGKKLSLTEKLQQHAASFAEKAEEKKAELVL